MFLDIPVEERIPFDGGFEWAHSAGYDAYMTAMVFKHYFSDLNNL